jgi:hypothetical protein
MNVRPRPIVVTGILSLGFAAHVQSTAQTKLDSEVRTNQAAPAIPGVHDFDFSIGRWQVHYRRLKERSIWWLERNELGDGLHPRAMISAPSVADGPIRICW